MLIRPEWILAQMKGNTALVYTRTMGPFKDRKYISTEHPRWKETFNDRDLEHTEHLRFEYRKIFCIEQKLENRVKVDIDFGDDDDVVAIEQNPPVKGIASKTELQEKYANVYASAPKPGIERHKASAHPSAKAIFEEQKTIFEEHIQYQKSQGNDEFKKSIVKEFGSAMNNDGTLPSSVLPNDAKMKFGAALRNNTGEYKVNEDTNEVTLDEDYLGDIMNQVANLH